MSVSRCGGLVALVGWLATASAPGASMAGAPKALPAGGAMLAVQGDAERVGVEVERLLAGQRQVSVAAHNAPGSVVLSGSASALEAIGKQLEAAGLRTRPLQVSHAFHSPLIEPMLAEYERIAGAIQHHAPQIAWVSNLTGEPMDWARWSGSMGRYWRDHVREPVRFESGVRAAARSGAQVFVEVGPHAVLAGLGQETLGGAPLTWLPSLRRGRGAWEQLLESVAHLYTLGARLDWVQFAAPYRHKKLSLPTYPFQRERYWIEKKVARDRTAVALSQEGRTLLGRRIDSPALDGAIFESQIGRGTAAEFAIDHRVFGVPILPGTAYLAVAVDAASRVFESGAVELRDVEFREALALPDEGLTEVQLVTKRENGDALDLKIFSRAGATSPWTLHFAARAFRDNTAPLAADAASLYDRLREECTEAIEPQDFYADLDRRGLEFGPLFRGVDALRRGPRDAIGEAVLPASLHSEARSYRIHPVLLDACVQVLAAVTRTADSDDVFLPVQIASCRIETASVPIFGCRAHATLRERSTQVLSAEVHVHDAAGKSIATFSGVRLQRAGREALDRLRSGSLAQLMLELRWEPDATVGRSAWTSPVAIADAVRPGISRNSMTTGWHQWAEVGPQLDAVCRAYISKALSTLGWTAETGARFDAANLAARLHIKPAFVRLLDRFLAILATDHVLQKERGAWQVMGAPVALDADKALAALTNSFPEFCAEFAFVKRCGPRLADVLTGQCDPLTLLFPDGDASTAERLYRDSPSALLYNGIIRDAVADAVTRLPAGRPLRVLEIGGGTASTTAHVVPILPAERTSYLFTDISPLFAARAEERFAQHGFVRAQALDIERDPRAQGIEGEFDIVIAANVLHATRDLDETFRHVRQLLAPGGLFVGLEVTRPQDWIDITFGLTDGWWRFIDADLRADYPLIDAPAWRRFLAAQGFDEVALLPDDSASSHTPHLNSVIIARAPLQTTPAKSAKRNWLLLADQGGIAEQVGARLQEQGHSVCLAFAGKVYEQNGEQFFDVNPQRSEDVQRLMAEATRAMGGPVDRVLHLWSLDAESARPRSLEQLREQSATVSGGALHVVQALLGQSHAPPLWVITRGGVALAGQPVSAASATLWGLARSLRLEHSELRCISVDLDPADAAGSAEAVLASVHREDDESQLAWRNNVPHLARVARLDRARRTTDTVLKTPAGASRLATSARGVLDNLFLEPFERRVPGQGEVEIRVRATGLNFRDVLAALDMYPGDQGPLGSECAGVISVVGPGVHDLRAGDEVIAIAPGAFATHVITRAALVVAKPRALTAAEAASIPNAFLTAHWALNHLGRMKSGHRVLIHAAAGGVGLAAVQLAQRAGAEIFATAGSDAKRAYLRSLGISHVFNSRTVEFAREIREVTDGVGVDLVLNCLAGEFIDKSLGLVAPGGRFLEIGRTGIWSAAQVSATYPGIEYHAVDLSLDYLTSPEVVRPMLLDLLGAVEAGKLRPLPIRTFNVDATDAAFRFMAQARHIGKLVVVQPWTPDAEIPLVRSDGTYWVTGGLSGLGLAAAGWLADRGARHLLLMGRRAPDAAAQAKITEFVSRGVQVLMVQGDVANESDVMGAIARVRASHAPRLAGVVHAAGSLDNGEIQSQSVARYAKVYAAKVDGAWLLDRATVDEPLDFFVLFSSVASLLGAAGQSNHAAANAYLDAFAHVRRAAGRPAISIQWGAWSDIGAAAGKDVAARLNEKGLDRIAPSRGLAAFEQVLRNAPAETAVVAADWPRFVEQLPPDSRRYLSQLATARRPTTNAVENARAASTQPQLLAQIAAAPLNSRRGILQNEIRARAIKVLGLASAYPLDIRAPLAGLGLDSLMAVELRNLLGQAVARTLPATLLFDHPTVAALTEHLAQLLKIDPEPTAALDAAPAEQGLLDRVESLSEDELDRLLAAKMEAS
ncbi:MAG: SDR family NAD(P)-dependent oxidoreductase [Gammaproteobacteria bacterium]